MQDADDADAHYYSSSYYVWYDTRIIFCTQVRDD